MHSRVLMELLAINIGLQKGTIVPALFSMMMMLMATVTTMMAGPLFELVMAGGRGVRGELDGPAPAGAA